MEPNQYRIKMSQTSGRYYIQKNEKFLFFNRWKDQGYMDGAAGYTWLNVVTYKTPEEALAKIVKLIKEDEKTFDKIHKIDVKVKNFKDIVVDSDTIREKLPQYFL